MRPRHQVWPAPRGGICRAGDAGCCTGGGGFGPGFDATRWSFRIDEYTSLAPPLIAGAYAYTATTDFPPYAPRASRAEASRGRAWTAGGRTDAPLRA